MEGNGYPVNEIQLQLALWVEQTKRLVIALPTFLTEFDQMRGEAARLQGRISDLESENQYLRRSRDDLAETFGRLKMLIAGCHGNGDAAVSDPQPWSSPSAAAPVVLDGSRVSSFSVFRQPSVSPHN